MLGTVSVVNGTSARTASAAGHLTVAAEVAIAIDASAIKPGRVEELPRLYVEADCDRAFFTKCIGRGPAAVTSAEVDRHALVSNENESIEVAVAIMIAILLRGPGRGKRTKSYHEENGEDGHDARCAALLRSTVLNLMVAIGNFHCTPFEWIDDSTPDREIGNLDLIGW